MPAREAEISPEVEMELAAPAIAKRTAEMVERERRRGWAFKNEDGRYRRQDVFDRLLAGGQVTDLQHQAGKRYQRQFSAAFEYGRCVSTLEFRRSDHALSDGGVQSALYLGQTYRQALGSNPRLAGVMAKACGDVTAIRDIVGLRAALSRLVNYYADLEDESDEIEVEPGRRTLRDRAADIAVLWEGGNLTGQRRYHYIPDKAKRLIWEAQAGRCAICGASLDAQGSTLDHVQPLSKGGLDGPGNLAVAHRTCNQRKGSANPSRYQLDALASINEILGWGETDDEPSTAEKIAAALARAANPVAAPATKARHVHVQQDAAAPEPVDYLEKPSRAESNMHEKWLAVLKSNRSMRARGVNAASRRK